MNKNPKKMYRILVPASKRGKKFSFEHHKIFDDKVKSIAGGLTVHKGSKGEWLNPVDGQLHTDRMIPVDIAVSSRKEIDEIANFALTHYDQLAILYFKISDEVVFLSRKTT